MNDAIYGNKTPVSSQVSHLETLINKNTEYSRAIRETTSMGRKFTLGLSKIANHVEIAKTILSIYRETRDAKVKTQLRGLISKNIESKKAGNWIRLGKEMVEMLSPSKKEETPEPPMDEEAPTASEFKETPSSSISEDTHTHSPPKAEEAPDSSMLEETPTPSVPKEVLIPAPHYEDLIPRTKKKSKLNVKRHNQAEGTTKILSPSKLVSSILAERSYQTSDNLRNQINRDLTKRPEISVNSSGKQHKLRFQGIEENPHKNNPDSSAAQDFNEVFPKDFNDEFTLHEQQCIVALSLALATDSSIYIAQHEISKMNREPDQFYTMSAPSKKEDVQSQITIKGKQRTFETSIKYQVKSVEPAGFVGSFTVRYKYDLNHLDRPPIVTQEYQPYDQFLQLQDKGIK